MYKILSLKKITDEVCVQLSTSIQPYLLISDATNIRISLTLVATDCKKINSDL